MSKRQYYLQIMKLQPDDGFEELVAVASSERNLQSVALAVAGASPVLLQGPVGSGKTALVEHLAYLTGRTSSELVKIQLGDQTDSKVGLFVIFKCISVIFF